MSYFIFQKNMDSVDDSLYKIADNENDLNSLNIIQNDYKIIQDSQNIYNDVRYNKLIVFKHKENHIQYRNYYHNYKKKEDLETVSISRIKQEVGSFLLNNQNHVDFYKWKSYLDQVNNFDYKTINYPLTISLEEYFKKNEHFTNSIYE